MNVILFGATGMVGQGVLRECLLDPSVKSVLAVGRAPVAQQHPKLKNLVHKDFTNFAPVEAELTGYDACFFCLGISSAGMSEADYMRVTHDYALAPAKVLAKQNPGMTFVFISGTGADSTEKGRTMWARVKGKTENDLLALPFKATYVFRPAFIRPLHGITSRTKLYKFFYVVLAPLFPVINALFPKQVTTTERLGRAMLKAARDGAPKRVLEQADINGLVAGRHR